MSPIFVFDMEWTTWEGTMARKWSGPNEHREVVQIGALRFEPASGGTREAKSFSMLVRPHLNPQLSAYFTDLTGITQAEIDADGKTFEQALSALSDFFGPEGTIWSNGGDEEVLIENCGLYGLNFTLPADRFRDAHPLLISHTGLPSSQLVSADLPGLIGGAAPAGGRPHDALTDARALAGALALMNLLE